MAKVVLGVPGAKVRFARALEAAGHEVIVASASAEICTLCETAGSDVLVFDLAHAGDEAMAVIERSRTLNAAPDIIVITRADRLQMALDAVRAGASEYIIEPVHPQTLLQVIERTAAMRSLASTNELLRQYVALADAARRIATARDRPQLMTYAYATFPQLTGAWHTLIYSRDDVRCSLQPGHRLDGEATAALAKYYSDELKPIQNLDGFRQMVAPIEGMQAFVYPAKDKAALHTFVVCLYTRTPSDAEHQAAAYLARNLALGIEHQERATATKELANRDHLTSLFNMRYLQMALEHQLEVASKAKQPFSVLFLDLDHFKQINDTHGHRTGSLALVELAHLLRACVRETDVVARYGGDEFVVLLPKADAHGATLAAERIRRRVQEHHFLAREGKDLHLTTCIGIASYPEHGGDTVRLLELADHAMYRGKRAERGVVHIADQKN